MTLVVDASLVVAALVDMGPLGEWAEDQLARGALAAPHLMPAEVCNILRRAVLTGELSADAAALALEDLGALPMTFFPYAPFAERVWQLRNNVTSYDAWYVAVAEAMAAPLATLDDRLGRASGPTCRFLQPPR